MAAALYLDTSAVLRATLESGTTPDVEAAMAAAELLVTSRVALVESSRALLRVQADARLPESALAQVERAVEAVWARCDVFEVTRAICDSAARVAPRRALRALDALHLATFLAARREIDGLALLTADERLRAAAEGFAA